jgi:pimeloyl-ACP methyl ester carboxylesterase
MLALAFAAAHPEVARALVLIGCGTFDKAARARLQETLRERKAQKRGQPAISQGGKWRQSPVLRAKWWKSPAFLRMYAHELTTTETEIESYDARGAQETWDDMVRMQEAGVYPAAFSAIHVPVLMLHGAADPHPGRMIEASLRPYLPQLEYREWERCGHYPWLEKAVHEEFFSVLREWLAAR